MNRPTPPQPAPPPKPDPLDEALRAIARELVEGEWRIDHREVLADYRERTAA